MSLSLLDDCQPCLQEVSQPLYSACRCLMVYLFVQHATASYIWYVSPNPELLRDFTSNTLCFSCSPLINWPPCASGHLETKPFLRDPNHAQKRAKCMYRIKGSNPVLVMLQKRHLTEDTKHVYLVCPPRFEWEYFQFSLVAIREFSGPGCGVQIRESSRRPFLRCRGMYKVSIALYPDVFIKQGCSTFESHNWNQDVSCS